MTTPPARLTAAESTLLVIDAQEKLLAAIPGMPRLLLNLSFLLDAARAQGVRILATEQYPKGLGPTHPAIIDRLPKDRPTKVVFGCGGVPEVIDALAGRSTVLLAGIEAHVCVLQTALDLMDRGLQVFVAADAVASRDEFDRDVALRRVERAGAVLITAETAAFEWLGSAASPAFKTVSLLVQERSRRLRELTASGVPS
ncbi:MAG TPA: isochorismatase family protein [Gemmataceae bacterium]